MCQGERESVCVCVSRRERVYVRERGESEGGEKGRRLRKMNGGRKGDEKRSRL